MCTITVSNECGNVKISVADRVADSDPTDPFAFAVLEIRIRRIRMFLGLLDPDPGPLVRGTDPDPSLSS
jgi:hypothetical protein